jgi:transposase
MYYVGLDYHLNSSNLCILDEQGQTVKQMRVKGRWPQVMEAIKALPCPFSVAFEASCGYGLLYEQLCRIAHSVQVAHPRSLRLIYKAKRKNDRIDAAKLAKLLYVDAIPAVHVPSMAGRDWRRLVELRRTLVRRRVAVKNQMRALLNNLGLESPRRLFSCKALAELGQRAMNERSALERDLLLEQLRQFSEQIRRVQRELNQIGQGDPRVTLLQSVPGVGPRTAEAFCAYVDRIERFGRSNKLGSYFGLVPCQDASAGANRLGHITKEGPSAVRQMLTEAAWMGIRKDKGLQAKFERICHGRPERRKIAVVAIAHHLACAMGAMLRSGQAWRSTRQAAKPAAA